MFDCQAKKILLNSLEINCRIAGVGQPILVLHGWGSSSRDWLEMQKILSQKGFQVICPDLPGFGQSADPAEPWSLADYVAWTINLIDYLKLKNIVIIGHSFGGRVAIKLSSAHQAIINKLILIGSAGLKPELSFKQKVILKTAKLGQKLFPLGGLRSLVRQVFYYFLRHKDYVKAKPIMQKTMQNVLAEDLLSVLSQIRIKTLLVWGEKDRMVPLQSAHIFAQEIKEAELKIIPGAGHSPQREFPQKTADIILEFLQS